MIPQQANRNDYYEAWDRHFAFTLVQQIGFHAARDKCARKKWSHLERVLKETAKS